MIVTSYQDGPKLADAQMFNNELGSVPFLSFFDNYAIGEGFIRFRNTADGSFMKVYGDFAVSDHAEAGLAEYDTAAGIFWLGSGKVEKVVFSIEAHGGELRDVNISARQLLDASNSEDVGRLDDLLSSDSVTATLSARQNLFYGSSEADEISVASGRNTVSGGKGDDILRVTAPASGAALDGKQLNFLSGSYGDDVLIGWKQSDELYGHYGDDILRGGRGSDRLFGSFGDDRLDGGRGDDVLNGTQGSDIFWFGKNSGHDVIWHFHTRGPEQDTIEGVRIQEITGHGADTILSFEGDNQVVLHDVKPSQLEYLL
jgi:Ca2+-binding RTX toxin-like protein